MLMTTKDNNTARLYTAELAALVRQIEALDEEHALEVLEDAFDHARALLSEQKSVAKPTVTLDQMTKSLRLDG